MLLSGLHCIESDVTYVPFCIINTNMNILNIFKLEIYLLFQYLFKFLYMNSIGNFHFKLRRHHLPYSNCSDNHI